MNISTGQLPKKRKAGGRQRGAALILVVIVMLVLSTIGIAMVSFTETEENTAASYRDQMQVQALAEAGVRLAVQMFRTPANRSLVPLYAPQAAASSSSPTAYDYYGMSTSAVDTSLNAIGIFRRDRPGGSTTRYSGDGNRFFFGPYDQFWVRYFGGQYNPDPSLDAFDLSFRRSAPGSATPIAGNWLSTNIDPLVATGSNWNENVGRISEISFFAPPIIGDQTYGFATVRVTAEKVDVRGRVVARETVEAVIGNNVSRPSILTNGDLMIESSSAFCGSTCEHIHANGNITIRSSSELNGGDPVVTAQGTVSTQSNVDINPPALQFQDAIPAPMINPWELIYRPREIALLDRYYLLTNRTPADAFLDDDPSTTIAAQTCTDAGGVCQDFGLEYFPGTTNPRPKTNQSRLYRWDRATENWDQIGAAINDGESHTLGVGQFRYHNLADQAARTDDFGDPVKAVADDTAMMPFNKNRAGLSYWDTQGIGNPAAGDPIQNIVLLVDGNFEIGSSAGGNRSPGQPAWRVSLITVGGFRLGSSSNMDPALENRVLWAAGRDIQVESSFNNDLASGPQQYCTSPNHTNPPNTPEHFAASAVIAAHEQVHVGSSAKLLGILVAENQINLHDNVNSGFRVFQKTSSGNGNNAMFIQSSSNHGYVCGQPDWPFNTQGEANILAMSAAGR